MCTTDTQEQATAAGTERAAIEAMLVRATMDVLESSPERFEHRGDVGPPPVPLATASSFVAHLGFGGERLRGCLVVVAGASVVRAMQPEEVRPFATSDGAVRDLLGELANLILGRLKTHLIRRGLVILLATPTTVSGRELDVSRAAASTWHALVGKDGPLFVRLDADLSDFDAFGDESSPAGADAMDDGEMVLF